MPVISGNCASLFNRIVEFTVTEHQSDIQVCLQLTKLKGKKSIPPQVYQEGMNKLMSSNVTFPFEIFKEIVVSIAKGKPILNQLVIDCFRQLQQTGDVAISRILQELAYNNDEHFLRKVITKLSSILQASVEWVNVCGGVLEERPEMFNQNKELAREWVMKLVDVVCCCMIVNIPSSVQESSLSTSNNPQKMAEKSRALNEWRFKLKEIQTKGIIWCKDVAPKYLQTTEPAIYVLILKKLLFMNPISSYFSVRLDVKTEKQMHSLLAREIPVSEESITTVAYIFDRLTEITKSFCNSDALEILESMVFRAALLAPKNEKALCVNNVETINEILKLSTYPTPLNCEPPKSTLCVSAWFWQASLINLLIATFNTKTIGKQIWQNLPSIRALMEMTITREWNEFPPPHCRDPKQVEQILENAKDSQQRERQVIIEFEKRVAESMGKGFEETSSVLLSQLMFFDPSGLPRKPATNTVTRIRTYETSLKLGKALCASREPDFVLELMSAESGSNWLIPIITKEPEFLEVIPPRCMCQLLLAMVAKLSSKPEIALLTQEQIYKLLERFLSFFSERRYAVDVLDFFLQRLFDEKNSKRQDANNALSYLVSFVSKRQANKTVKVPLSESLTKQLESSQQVNWLLQVFKLPVNASILTTMLTERLATALQKITSPEVFYFFLSFLFEQQEDATSLTEQVSLLIINRPFVWKSFSSSSPKICSVVFQIFTKYLRYIVEKQKKGDKMVTVFISNSYSLEINANIFQGILSTLCTVKCPKEKDESYNFIVQTFFPNTNLSTKPFILDNENNKYPLLNSVQAEMLFRNCPCTNYTLLFLSPRQCVDLTLSFGTDYESLKLLFSHLEKLVVDNKISPTDISDPKKVLERVRINKKKKIVLESSNFEKFVERQSHSDKMEDESPSLVFELAPEDRKFVPLARPLEISTENISQLLSSLFTQQTNGREEEVLFGISQFVLSNFSSSKTRLVEILCENFYSSLKSNANLFSTKLVSSTRFASLFKLCVTFDMENSGARQLIEALSSYVNSKDCPFELFESVSTLLEICLGKSFHQYLPSVAMDEKSLIQNLSNLSLKCHYTLLSKQAEEVSLSLCLQNKWEQLSSLIKELSSSPHFRDLFQRFFERLLLHLFSKSFQERVGQVNVAEKVVVDLFVNSSSSIRGLAFDWVSKLVPDLLSPSLLQHTFFSKEGQVNNYVMELSSLLHASSWKTLSESVSLIFSNQGKLDLSASLDFMHSLVYHPRSLIGFMDKDQYREAIQSNFVSPLLNLSPFQVANLVYMVLRNSKGDIPEKHLSLVLFFCKKAENLDSILLSVSPLSTIPSSEALLSQLYLYFPHAVHLFHPNFRVSSSFASGHNKILPNLLKRLWYPQQSITAYVVLRKFCIDFPDIVLSSLPTLKALLKGTTVHEETEDFIISSNHVLYIQMLGLFDALRPNIMQYPFVEELDGMLEFFFEFFDSLDSYFDEICGLIIKFVDFMFHYVREDRRKQNILSNKNVSIL